MSNKRHTWSEIVVKSRNSHNSSVSKRTNEKENSQVSVGSEGNANTSLQPINACRNHRWRLVFPEAIDPAAQKQAFYLGGLTSVTFRRRVSCLGKKIQFVIPTEIVHGSRIIRFMDQWVLLILEDFVKVQSTL